MSIIEAREVAWSFGSAPALRGATVAAAPGEILAVTGPRGSGKSTLLYCLAGIFTPDGGEVHYDGRRVDTMPEPARTQLRRTAFGFVFRSGQLVPELTAADTIALPMLVNRVRRGTAYARAANWLDRLGLRGLGGRRIGELSGGQVRRVAIARALAVHPKVLFADEPAGSLRLLVGLARADGVTVVLATRDRRVARVADRCVVVRDGRVSGAAEARAPR
ncbi:ABC transporter ATP-binding protein [Dactylosporangium sp. NPDC051541]|uniref:ABC transporter ATP-binding protein n=1 Tax=Dactylosporangium sp. NPDC051541 TaxID=3363977 RepID=UPI0037A60B8D